MSDGAQLRGRAGSAGTDVDHRKRPRRRGEALHRAIFEATFAELREAGYSELTMERIAERARTSKASLYRRWPGKADLVMDTLSHHMPHRDGLPDTGNVREDSVTLLRGVADQLAGPLGQAVRGLVVDFLRDPELRRAAQARIMNAGVEPMLEILRRGAARGEVHPQSVTPRTAGVGPALLRHHFLFRGPPVADEVIAEIVDEVVVPLVRPTDPSAVTGGRSAQRPTTLLEENE